MNTEKFCESKFCTRKRNVFGISKNRITTTAMYKDLFRREFLKKRCFRSKVIVYPLLGLKGATGNWSGLLGAVIQQEVDVGLDSITRIPERYTDMFFTHTILKSIRNIYLKPEESNSARDIYLEPFGSELLVCVLATAIIFATVMSVYITTHRQFNPDHRETGTIYSAMSDAILWCCAVISMQGTLVKTKSYAGNLIVVISLLFSLIIYNSYAAFITSILSVNLIKIRTVDDLLESDYDIGYTKNSQDEVYLRTMDNETQLNQIYLRGYLHNNINNITDGLLKATKGNYGFFATGHIARKNILEISGYKCKYEIMEIPVKSTQNYIAFPMSLNSPYRKLVNKCINKMDESGVQNYIGLLMKPHLLKCEQKQDFQSAGINDLSTSFILLGIGILMSIIVIIMECLWKKRKVVYSKIQNGRINPALEFIK